MSKICILSTANIKHMSLITLYTQRLEQDGIDYDIIYNDRYGEVEESNATNVFRFENIISTEKNSKIEKFFMYSDFVSYAKKIISNNNYSFIIVWNEVTAFLFSSFLVKEYKGQYCINIRDYLYQDRIIIKQIFNKVVKSASFVTISSKAYEQFLPKHDYVHIHSLNQSILSNVTPRMNLVEKNRPILISFIGNVRFYDQNIKLLNCFKNDNRFILGFYGSNSQHLKKYCDENGIFNVSFYSSFPPRVTNKFIEKTDIINNIYGNNDKSLDYAISIKLYYAIYSRIPILVSPDTYMEKITEKYGIGFTVDLFDKDLPNRIYNWYHSIDYNEFLKSCLKALKEIEQSNTALDEVYKKFIKASYSN